METIRRKQQAALLLLSFVLGVIVGLLLPKNGGFSPDPAVAAAFSPLTTETGFSLETLPPAPESASVPKEEFTISVVARGGLEKKRVLIYHTHTYEAYAQDRDRPYEETAKWRSADPDFNMVRVGEELAALLRALGYEVVHDTTAFEPPDLDTAYSRSLDMLTRRRDAGESYDLWIDLHRDAYVEGQTANTVAFGGNGLARLMFLIGKGQGQTGQGFQEKPDWEENLKYAQSITDELNRQIPGLCKNVMLKSGRFNQHVSTGCVLIEVGNNQNSLAEALRSMPYLADAIRQALSGD